jgi:DMSO/TMAO reductase YedYZ molybdopterin-dependent catalytic subunit
MKLGKREFMRLIPLAAVAIVTGSWWFFGQTKEEVPAPSQTTATTTMASQATSTTSVAPQITSTTSTAPPVASTTSTTEAFDFPITWNGDEPTAVNPNDYRLTIDGNVSKSLEFTLLDLQAMPSVQKTAKIECVTGWAANVPWEGIPLLYLLSQAGVSPENIARVTIKSITGYETTLNSDEVADSDSIIALKAGGLPLTVEHGYPARLVAPTRLGLDWVKYVTRITCTSK